MALVWVMRNNKIGGGQRAMLRDEATREICQDIAWEFGEAAERLMCGEPIETEHFIYVRASEGTERMLNRPLGQVP